MTATWVSSKVLPPPPKNTHSSATRAPQHSWYCHTWAALFRSYIQVYCLKILAVLYPWTCLWLLLSSWTSEFSKCEHLGPPACISICGSPQTITQIPIIFLYTAMGPGPWRLKKNTMPSISVDGRNATLGNQSNKSWQDLYAENYKMRMKERCNWRDVFMGWKIRHSIGRYQNHRRFL